MLQLWFAPGGVRGDFILAALIVFAFVFSFWELFIFALLGVFLVNSSPHLSVAMIVFFLIPLAAYFVRRRFPLNPWMGAAGAIAAGIALFYAATAPVAASGAVGFLVLDILASIFFGESVLYGLE